MRIFRPLKADHPLVSGGEICPACNKPFFEGQRTVLAAIREPVVAYENVPALPLHASCAFEGAEVIGGIVDRIKDGDASPYPVLLKDGRQCKFEEVGLEGQ